MVRAQRHPPDTTPDLQQKAPLQPDGELCRCDKEEACLKIIRSSLRKPNYIFTSRIKTLVG